MKDRFLMIDGEDNVFFLTKEQVEEALKQEEDVDVIDLYERTILNKNKPITGEKENLIVKDDYGEYQYQKESTKTQMIFAKADELSYLIINLKQKSFLSSSEGEKEIIYL